MINRTQQDERYAVIFACSLLRINKKQNVKTEIKCLLNDTQSYYRIIIQNQTQFVKAFCKKKQKYTKRQKGD